MVCHMPPTLTPRSRRPPSPAACRPGERARREIGGYANTDPLPRPSSLSPSVPPFESDAHDREHGGPDPRPAPIGVPVPVSPQKCCWIDAGSDVAGGGRRAPATSAPAAPSSSPVGSGVSGRRPNALHRLHPGPIRRPGTPGLPIVMRARRHRTSAQGRGGPCGSARMSRTRGSRSQAGCSTWNTPLDITRRDSRPAAAVGTVGQRHVGDPTSSRVSSAGAATSLPPA
jgi:hypothetical protein